MFTRILIFLAVSGLATGCEMEANSYPESGYAKLYYTPDCATINGYVIMERSNKTYVFQHEIDEEFHGTGLEVYIEYKVDSEPVPLTADCTQAEVITLSSLESR